MAFVMPDTRPGVSMQWHRKPPDKPSDPWALINIRLARIEAALNASQNATNRKLTELMTNQQHIEQDVTAITASIATAVAELKAQIAAGTPAEALDFTSLDNLASSTAAEAAADAPAV